MDDDFSGRSPDHGWVGLHWVGASASACRFGYKRSVGGPSDSGDESDAKIVMMKALDT